MRARSAVTLAGSILLALAPMLAACPGSLSFQYVPPDGDVGTGGSDSSGGAGGASGGGCANAMNLLQTQCASCHMNPPFPAAYTSLNLLAPGAAARLVGQPADAANASSDACAGKGNILNSGTLPATGILIDKIKGTQTCGSSMPYGLPLLGPSDIACLQAWADDLVQSAGN